MKSRLITGGIFIILLTGIYVTVIRPFVDQAREALSGSFQELEGIDEQWQDLGVPESFTGPVGDLPAIPERMLDVPEEMFEGLTVFMGQDGETFIQTYLEVTKDGLVKTTASAGNKIALIPVARQWETTDGEPAGCSSRFKITKADPWEQDNHFYVTVEFIGSEGQRLVSCTNYISPEFTTEWVVDVEEYAELSAPWCGLVVITVQDDISDPPDLLSQKYQVQVEALTFCDCLE